MSDTTHTGPALPPLTGTWWSASALGLPASDRTATQPAYRVATVFGATCPVCHSMLTSYRQGPSGARDYACCGARVFRPEAP